MIRITIEINDEKIEEFKLGFLKVYPVPFSIDMDTGKPRYLMTENEWIVHWTKQQIKDAYARGKTKIAKENMSVGIDEGVILS